MRIKVNERSVTISKEETTMKLTWQELESVLSRLLDKHKISVDMHAFENVIANDEGIVFYLMG